MPVKINEQAALFEQISDGITTHGLWKERLHEAVETGQSDFTPDEIRADNNCSFGKWLEAIPRQYRNEYYDLICSIHEKFHSEAADILAMALDGRQEEAKNRILPGTPYADLTVQLIMGAAMWMQQVKSN